MAENNPNLINSAQIIQKKRRGRPPGAKNNKKKSFKKSKPGPTSGCTQHVINQVYKFALAGFKDIKIAELLNISQGTVIKWKHEHPKFAEALELGREKATAEVGKSLYERAIGYKHPDVVVGFNKGEPIVVPITKHYPPDVAAIKHWLGNKEPDLWKEKTEQTTTLQNPNGSPIQQFTVIRITNEELPKEKGAIEVQSTAQVQSPPPQPQIALAPKPADNRAESSSKQVLEQIGVKVAVTEEELPQPASPQPPPQNNKPEVALSIPRPSRFA